MRKLAERNHVIWVNWHASRRPTVHWEDLRTIGRKITQIGRGARHVSDNITVITPWQIPLPGSRMTGRFNTYSVCRSIRRVLDRLPSNPIQFWSFAPDVGDFAGQFGEEVVVYYCVDAFGEFPGYDRELIERREKELLGRSDLVITTSQPLYTAKSQLHPNVELIEHGVNHAHLSKALSNVPAVPEDLRDLPRPVVGYVGVIGEWVDVDLVADLARHRPDWSIVLIGPSLLSELPFEGLSNVYRLGERAHEALPPYLRQFDVGLIPFHDVPLTHHANPIKLYEYLAGGVPVVSSPLPAVRPREGSVWLADDIEALITSCEAAIRNNTPEDRRRRSDSMHSHSWASRLEVISRHVVAASRSRAAGRQGRPAMNEAGRLVASST